MIMLKKIVLLTLMILKKNDSLDLVVLMERAILEGFPLQSLYFSLIQHAAPRALQAKGFTSDPVAVHNSILAGCKNAVALTRAYLLSSMKQLEENHQTTKDPNPPTLSKILKCCVVVLHHHDGDSWTCYSEAI